MPALNGVIASAGNCETTFFRAKVLVHAKKRAFLCFYHQCKSAHHRDFQVDGRPRKTRKGS